LNSFSKHFFFNLADDEMRVSLPATAEQQDQRRIFRTLLTMQCQTKKIKEKQQRMRFSYFSLFVRSAFGLRGGTGFPVGDC
jgi:hypothetical protein